MRAINNWNHLHDFGIVALTGEACNLGARLLCDLTKHGADIVREMYGLPPDCKLAENWNHGEDDNPHVASIMLPCESLIQVATFALLLTGFPVVAVCRHGVFGLKTEEELPVVKEMVGGEYVRTYGYWNHPHVGTRNVHAMSGRTL